jgi:hypothetical protein
MLTPLQILKSTIQTIQIGIQEEKRTHLENADYTARPILSPLTMNLCKILAYLNFSPKNITDLKSDLIRYHFSDSWKIDNFSKNYVC